MRTRRDAPMLYTLPGRYAMPRPPQLATLRWAAGVGFPVALVGAVLGIGLGWPWGLPLVSLGCLIVVEGCLIYLACARRFWVWLGRPTTPMTPTVPLVLTAIGAVALVVAFAVESAIALGLFR